MTIFSARRIAIAICLFVPLGITAQNPSISKTHVREADYKVFSAYIRQSFVGAVGEDRVGKPISQIVIVNRTESDADDLDEQLDPVDTPPGGVEGFLKKQAPSLRGATIRSFHQANAEHSQLLAHFDLPLQYQLLARKQIGYILKDISSWIHYYKQYPGAQGYLALSRVGYSSDEKQALFYASNRCGGKCATGSYVIMEKHGSAWKMVKEVFIWVS